MKQLLTEAGVIGGILDDFNPHFKLCVIYGNKRISLGDKVFPAEVQRRPLDFLAYYEVDHHDELMEALRNPSLVTVVSLNLISSLFLIC